MHPLLPTRTRLLSSQHPTSHPRLSPQTGSTDALSSAEAVSMRVSRPQRDLCGFDKCTATWALSSTTQNGLTALTILCAPLIVPPSHWPPSSLPPPRFCRFQKVRQRKCEPFGRACFT